MSEARLKPVSGDIADVLAGTASWAMGQGDARGILPMMPDGCVQALITSPPYWGLRMYKVGESLPVWDGDPDCQHKFEERAWYVNAGAATGQGGKAFSAPGPENAARIKEGRWRLAGECSCGAWQGQLGLEPTPEFYISHLVQVFRECWRVLRDDGLCWVVIGDTRSTGGGMVGTRPGGGAQGDRWAGTGRGVHTSDGSGKAAPRIAAMGPMTQPNRMPLAGYKDKDLIGIPFMLAFALRADGWYPRAIAPWAKVNAMPESTSDRPSTSHEYVLMLAKSGDTQFWTHRDGKATREKPEPDHRWRDLANGGAEQTSEPGEGWKDERLSDGGKRWSRVNLWVGWDYYYDQVGVMRPISAGTVKRLNQPTFDQQTGGEKDYGSHASGVNPNRSARRTLENFAKNGAAGRQWRTGDFLFDSLAAARETRGLITDEDGGPIAFNVSVASSGVKHFATFPLELVAPMIVASAPPHSCSGCGAPYIRVTGQPEPVEGRGSGNVARKVAAMGERGRTNSHLCSSVLWSPESVPTVRWGPSCQCQTPAVPAIILDPFAGTGTTGVSALKLGRRFIGLDISAEYVEAAVGRLST